MISKVTKEMCSWMCQMLDVSRNVWGESSLCCSKRLPRVTSLKFMNGLTNLLT